MIFYFILIRSPVAAIHRPPYQKELVESPPAGVGEIKIGLLITSILFLLSRGRSQTVNCQLSTVNC
ncbi:hypothetical protein [Microcoleus sp. CAWBG58]|uniref:hypothetical protein n=1 Tax=Microcoleus sp. CAWBG58 TaxID=2841651 RepID=UPI0025CE146E|nr:hypothetical protein [Microcoleus sp. CAWBG58]